jgi:hypothetical protein
MVMNVFMRLKFLSAGGLLAVALSASTLHRPWTFAAVGLALGLICAFLRNDFGDLFRALGLMLIYVLRRGPAGRQTMTRCCMQKRFGIMYT